MSNQSTPSVETISAATAKAMLSEGNEVAFLDVREHGQYGEGHPFFIVNCPYSRLEIDAVLLVPNRNCRIVLLDDGDGVSGAAAQRLLSLGYTNIFVLDGGAPGWSEAGYVLFKGVNVPSKAFGELVEEMMGTPSISAEELKELIQAGENMIVLDGRSPAEYNRMNIPTARSCPNGELGYRIADLAPDPSTKIVVNCAGRTRSIIGTQTLRDLGIDNEVVALRNGTQGWQLAGFDLEHGKDPGVLPEPSNSDRLQQSRARFIERNAIGTIGLDDLKGWLADAARTTFVFDVRTVEEFRAGHLPGAVHAPGGQLVQATDHWVGVRNARIVLCDNKSLRAATACKWLSLMGHDAVVLDCDVTSLEESAAGDDSAWPDMVHVSLIDTEQLSAIENPVLIDVSASGNFQEAHVEGAVWGIRPRLSRISPPLGRTLVVMARDPRMAVLAADELLRLGHKAVFALNGGLADWRQAGLKIVTTPDEPRDEDRIDFLFFVHDRHDGGLESARVYLKWETELLGQMDDAERSVFKKLDIHHLEAVQ